MLYIIWLQGMIKELIDYNLRHGSLQVRIEVRSLLCLLTKDNRRGTEEMNNLIMTRIGSALKGYLSNPDLVSGNIDLERRKRNTFDCLSVIGIEI